MYIHSSHNVSEIAIHLVFVCKYRRPFFRDPEVKETLDRVFHGLSNDLKFRLIASHIADEHVHLLVQITPSVAISDLVSKVKAKSSLILHKAFPRLRDDSPALWSSGYFAASVGGSSRAAAEHYINDHSLHDEDFR